MRYILLLAAIHILSSPALADFREVFEREFLLKPWAGAEVEESVCVECHTSEIMKPEYRHVAEEWKLSWHYQNRVSCHDCHGGDPEDAAMSMSPQRGFLGTPGYTAVPEFCGKCHVGILRNYLESGHGKALKAGKRGPNCVTCHGSHGISKASIEIINDRLCSRCHSYERAKSMKQALFLVEKKIENIEKDLEDLRASGVYTEDERKALFRTHAEFRALFHTIDVSLVKNRTDEFTKKLDVIQERIEETSSELAFRRNFSAFIMLLFAGMAVVVFLLSKTYMD